LAGKEEIQKQSDEMSISAERLKKYLPIVREVWEGISEKGGAVPLAQKKNLQWGKNIKKKLATHLSQQKEETQSLERKIKGR